MSYPVAIIPENVQSSDGRSYPAGLLTWRESIPLQFTDETTTGHEGAFQVGTISNIRRQTFEGETWILGDLTYDIDAEAAEAERLAVEGQIPGVSADIAVIFEETGDIDDMGFPLLEMVAAEIVGATQVPMPAFAAARILLDTQIPVLVAALPSDVDASWFADPQLLAPTPLTVEGRRVFGHLAAWDSCHTGNTTVCVSPPKGTDYRFFHTGAVEVDGEVIPVGQITMGTGHASLALTGMEARQAHYDNTGACAADVRAGEDEHGIWVAGALREGVDVATLRAAALSGDWRRVNGKMELLAALAVNVPGFPIPRLTASALNDEPFALVASGIVEGDYESEIEPDPLDEIRTRLDVLESLQHTMRTYTFPATGTNTTISAFPPDPEPEFEEGQAWGRLAEVLAKPST